MTDAEHILSARMELLHFAMERRGHDAERSALARGTAFRVLRALLDERPERHAQAWGAFARKAGAA